MSAEIHVGDTPIFRRTIQDEAGAVVDVSTATTKDLTLKKPDGTKLTKAMSFTNTGTDGKVQYKALPGDLDQQGRWMLQVKIVIPAGTFYTDTQEFFVEPVL